jgi:hypothetical protein
VVEALIDVPVASGDTVRPTGRGCQVHLVRAILHSAGRLVRRWWGFVDLDLSTQSDPCGDVCAKEHNYPVWNLGGRGEKYNDT